MNQSVHAKTSTPLYFWWPSGNFVVLISYETADVNDEFLRRYLDKHPSSL